MIQSRLTDYGMLARFGFFLFNGGNLFLLSLPIKSKAPAPISLWCFLILMIIIFFISSLIVVLISRKILIDLDKITYTNWLTGKTRIYNFKDLDGYVTVIRPKRVQGSAFDKDFESVILVKENKRIGEISSLRYSNYDELKDGLKDLKYLGKVDDDMFNNLKDLFIELLK